MLKLKLDMIVLCHIVNVWLIWMPETNCEARQPGLDKINTCKRLKKIQEYNIDFITWRICSVKLELPECTFSDLFLAFGKRWCHFVSFLLVLMILHNLKVQLLWKYRWMMFGTPVGRKLIIHQTQRLCFFFHYKNFRT